MTSGGTSRGAVARQAALVGVMSALVYGLLALFAVVGEDEPGFADVGRSGAKGLGFSSPLFTGVLPGAEHRVMWQPPGYFVVLAGWFRVVGFGLLEGRLLSVLAAGGAVAMVFVLARRYASVGPAVVATVVAGVSPWMLRSATLIRPDALALMLIVGSVLAVIGWDERRGAWRACLVVGCAGGAALMHPLGLIAAVTVGGYLLLRRQWAAGLLMPVAAVVIAGAVWVLYVAPYPAEFVEQMRLQGARKAGTDLFALLNAQDRWRKLAYAPLVAAAAVMLARRLRWPLAPTVAAGVAAAAATYGGEEVYPVYLIPLAAPILAVALAHLSKLGAISRVGVVAALVVPLVAGGVLMTRSVHDLGSSSALAAAVGPTAYLGQGAGGVYFATEEPSGLRMAVPVPVNVAFVAATARERGVAVAVDEDALKRWTGPLDLTPITMVAGRHVWRVP